MLEFNPTTFWLFLPVFLYAEMHYRIWNIFSRYFKREPEIVADVPHRLGPGKKLPIFICVKDAPRFPIVLRKLRVEEVGANHRLVYEKDYHSLAIADDFWYDVLEADLQKTGEILIDVTVTYLCRGKLKTCINDNYKLTSHSPFNVFVDAQPRPRLAGWVFGDMHTHSDLTSDQVEFGAPLPVSTAMARALELDFFASADHSYDLDDRLDNYLVNDPALPKWKMLWEQVEKFNAESKNLVIIPSEELSAGNANNRNVHYLIFNNRKFFAGAGDSAEKWLRTKPQHKISDVLPRLEPGALSYAAHPLIEPPLLQKWLIRRGSWPDVDLTAAGLHGAQFWNGDIEHFLKIGLPKWIELLLSGHKITLIAGTDAHGNFNRFRQIGTPHFTMREEQREIFGTALTGVFVEGKLSLNALLAGLSRGQVVVTDGPMASISCQPSAISYQFEESGGESSRVFMIGETIRTNSGIIFVEAVSSPAFGEIKELVLVVGDITPKKETRRIFKTPSGLCVFSTKEIVENLPRPGYLRLELVTQTGSGLHYCFTNPIYAA